MKTMLVLAAVAAAGAVAPLTLPGSRGGAGFDDLRFSPELRKLLVPGGRSGRLYLVDPKTHAVEPIEGFTAAAQGGSGHSEGTTSADSGEGLIFASDRNDRTLVVVDPSTKRILAREKLASGPDYVRWVAPLSEVWVTEPGAKVIEIWRLTGKTPPKLTPAGKVTTEVKKKTGQSPATINRRIATLIEQGIIEKVGAGPATQYRSTGLI